MDLNCEYHTYRIACGITIIRLNKRTILIKSPSSLIKYKSEVVYENAIRNGKKQKLMSDDDVNKLFWNEEQQKQLSIIEADINKLKVALYENFNNDIAFKTRQLLHKAKDKLLEYLEKKYKYSHISIKGYAYVAKTRYLFSKCVYSIKGKRISVSEYDIDKIISLFNQQRLNDDQIRFLARSNIWKSIWYSRKHTPGLFNCGSHELSDEQKALISWSEFYDNVAENPEAPKPEIIEDDDALDGWVIIQRQNKQNEIDKDDISKKISNEKISQADEVFIVSESKEDVPKVHKLNDDYAQMIKRQRANSIKDRGVIDQNDLPDVRQFIQMEFNKLSHGL